jgi:hypothetical protein
MSIPESVRELRPHAAWDIIKEGAKLMLPFLAGLGIKEWVHAYATALMWTAAFAIAFAIAFWDRIARRKAPKAQPVSKGTMPALSGSPVVIASDSSGDRLDNPLRIVSAHYGAAGIAYTEVTDAVRKLAKSDSLRFHGVRGSFNALFGPDPCFKVRKHLQVVYSFPVEVIFEEDGDIILPVPQLKTGKG